MTMPSEDRRPRPRPAAAVAAEPSPAEALAQARRLVVKVGSALLVGDNGEIRRAWLDRLADDVAQARGRGQEVMLVSSGAIAVGRRHLGLARRTLRLEEKQAAAADRADPPRPCLSGGAGAARHHRRADPADARRHRGAPPPPQRPRHLRAARWRWARCRSSTRTTPSRPPRSASATTTGSPPASRR